MSGDAEAETVAGTEAESEMVDTAGVAVSESSDFVEEPSRITGLAPHEDAVGTPAVQDSGDGDDEQIEDPRVLAAIERLADLEGLPIAEQVEVFADVHARLTEALGTESDMSSTATSESTSSGSASSTGQVSFGDPAS